MKKNKELRLITEGFNFKPVLTPKQFKQYHKNIDNYRKELIEDEIKFLTKLKNKKTSGRYVYETKDIDNRLNKLKEKKGE